MTASSPIVKTTPSDKAMCQVSVLPALSSLCATSGHTDLHRISVCGAHSRLRSFEKAARPGAGGWSQASGRTAGRLYSISASTEEAEWGTTVAQ